MGQGVGGRDGWRKARQGWFLCPPKGYELGKGERVDRKGRLWVPAPVGWLPSHPPWSTRLRVRPEVFWEPVRQWQEREAAGEGEVWPLRVALDPGWRTRWRGYRGGRSSRAAIPRQRFPAKPGEAVWGWRAQVVAWYWAVAWADPAVGLGYGMRPRVRSAVNRVGRGEGPWTVGLDRMLEGELARVRRAAAARRERLERARERAKGPRLQVGLLTGRLTVGR